MEWQFTPYAIPLFVGTAILLAIAIFSLRRYSTQGAMYLFWLSALLSFAVLGYAAELGSTSVDDVLFWFKFEYIGFAPATSMFLMLVLAFTGNQRYLNHFTLLVLFAVPAVTLVFAWTAPAHDLMWGDITLDRSANFTGVTFDRGSWYWVWFVHNYVTMALSMVILVRTYRRAPKVYRKQYAIVLVGMLLPATADIARAVGIIGLELAFSPYAFVASSVVFAFSMFQYQLFDIMPVAHEAVIASMTDAVIVMDTQRRILHLNPVARQLMGDRSDPIIGRFADDVFVQWPELVKKFRDVEQAHTEFSVDMPDETGQMRSRSFDMQLSTLYSNRKRKGRLVVLRDITSRVQAETSLRATNARLETLRQMDGELTRKLDVHYVASMTLDAALRISGADAAFVGLVEDEGIRIIHILGRFERKILNEVISPDKGITSRVVRNRIAEYVPDVTQDPDYFSISSATRSQITVPLLSGEELVGVLTLEARNPDQFTPEIFETLKLMVNRVGVAIDNARLYEETDQLVKELDAFAHTVAHDLKNPLAIIMAYAGMINADYPEGKLGEFSSAMVKSSQKAAGIIDALLLLAGVRSMQTMEVVPLAMGTIVNDVHARFVNLIDEYQPEIILPDQWLEAKGYGPWAEEIWANYFSNAIKYGGRPPRVELGSNRLDDGQIRFWMRDNGKGLTAEEQAQLFRPFTRLGQTDVKGHGLGLSIVQRIAERLNGDVGVESIVGQGSLFYFTLPAA